MFNIPAILFAGGKSSRMGRDKALLPFGKYSTLSEYQYRRLKTLFKEVYIAAKDDKFDFDAEIIYDRYEESSPLVGIVSVFETLPNDKVFILSVDAPFVDASVMEKLIKESEGYDAVIAKTKSGRQPLCGVYSRAVLDVALDNISKGDHRIGNVLKCVETHFVFFEEDALFANLNHPHEYQEALTHI